MNEEELKELASQLRHPAGEMGIKVAHHMNEGNIGMTRHAIASLGLQNDDAVLEIGHGNASHLPELLALARGLRYTGLDISADMHKEAIRINASQVNSGQASFHLYDGKRFPFSDGAFQRIFTVNTIYFWEDPRAMVSELHRVLAVGGTCAITFGDKDFMAQLPFVRHGFRLYNIADVADLIEGSGLQVIRSETQIESVKSIGGTVLERPFHTVVLGKA